MTRLEQKRSAPDVKAIGVNLATAGLIGSLIGPRPARAVHIGFGVAGVLIFFVGKSWE